MTLCVVGIFFLFCGFVFFFFLRKTELYTLVLLNSHFSNTKESVTHILENYTSPLLKWVKISLLTVVSGLGSLLLMKDKDFSLWNTHKASSCIQRALHSVSVQQGVSVSAFSWFPESLYWASTHVQERCDKIAVAFLSFFPGLLVSRVLMDTGARKRMTILGSVGQAELRHPYRQLVSWYKTFNLSVVKLHL